ncbi:hypothetical protein HBI56_095760 [Parastagonospora nodorum]|nr:hypothetical protein HBH53_215860 [Parastagonospora nodorum]KAH3957747.1 hypothetical protein HBH51_220660 [Parastagonospora nodorum]KAH4034366.1 hypothetical protein HBI09_109640 [Parastagonospora nodorum]KAH4057258.1 hypothetical protein HBH49_043830 [Parastagonospora nodorum]KAH4109977.1 hypothetical protein HBH46_017240 [Parastagonospora nodorum]
MSEHISSKAALTVRNRYGSPLLSLPGEIRNHIYDFVFKTSSTISSIQKNSSAKSPTSPQTVAIYKEAHILPFTLPTLKFGSVHDFMRFHAGLTYVQRSAIKRVRFEIQGANPDIAHVDHQALRGSDDSPAPRRAGNANEVKKHDDRKKQSASRMERQVTKAQKIAAEKAKKGKGKGKGNFKGEGNTLQEPDEEETAIVHKGAKRSQQSISLLLPCLEQVEVVYKHYGAKWYGLSETDQSHERIKQYADEEWKTTNRELFEKWLEGDASEKTRVVYFPWAWDRESAPLESFARDYDGLLAEDDA